MLISKITFLFILVFSNMSFANLQCLSSDLPDEYAVEVHLSKNKAAFFDNDSWTYLDMVSDIGESSSIAIYSGLDIYGSEVVVRIDFSEGMVQHHSLTFERYNEEVSIEEEVTVDLHCVFSSNLNSGL